MVLGGGSSTQRSATACYSGHRGPSSRSRSSEGFVIIRPLEPLRVSYITTTRTFRAPVALSLYSRLNLQRVPLAPQQSGLALNLDPSRTAEREIPGFGARVRSGFSKPPREGVGAQIDRCRRDRSPRVIHRLVRFLAVYAPAGRPTAPVSRDRLTRDLVLCFFARSVPLSRPPVPRGRRWDQALTSPVTTEAGTFDCSRLTQRALDGGPGDQASTRRRCTSPSPATI